MLVIKSNNLLWLCIVTWWKAQEGLSSNLIRSLYQHSSAYFGLISIKNYPHCIGNLKFKLNFTARNRTLFSVPLYRFAEYQPVKSEFLRFSVALRSFIFRPVITPGFLIVLFGLSKLNKIKEFFPIVERALIDVEKFNRPFRGKL